MCKKEGFQDTGSKTATDNNIISSLTAKPKYRYGNF